MEIVMLGNKTISKLRLPAKVEGSFFLKDPLNDENLLNIDAINGEWCLLGNSKIEILDKSNTAISKSAIIDQDYYFIKSKNSQYLIYCQKSNDSTFSMYKVNQNCNLVFGKGNSDNIIYNNSYIKENHFTLCYQDGFWKINTQSDSFIYLNDSILLTPETLLNNGDFLYTYGLKIYVMKDYIIFNNPANNVILNTDVLVPITIDQKEYEYEEVQEEDYYTDQDYFFHTPRIRRFIDTYDLTIANPPNKPSEEEMPLLLTLGPMLTMALMSVLMAVNNISRLVTGQTTLAKSWLQLVSPAIMLTSSLLWPNLIKRFNKKKRQKKEKIRQKEYRAYIEEKRKEILSETINQTAIMRENLITLKECYNNIINKKRTLWERKITQRDFLTVRVGTGDYPIDMDIKFSDDEFVIEKDELKEEAAKMVNEAKILHNVPVSYSFFKKQATAIMGNDAKLMPFVNNILLQLISFHSFSEFKIVIFTNENNKNNWKDYLQLPHLFSDDKSVRFFASNMEDAKYISDYLEQEFIKRISDKDFSKVENEGDEENQNGKVTYSPYYLIFTDDYMMIRKLGICERVFDNNEDFGFSFVILEKRLSHLPSKCINFITFDNVFCGILRNDVDDYYHQEFKDEIDTSFNMKKCVEVLSNIPIEFEQDLRHLPTMLTFLEMYGVGKVEQLNIMNRWKLNDPTKSLRAALGVNDQSNIIYLDLHEKYHGPHGLIAGTTGSGKSELIITYILSMCINYSPNEVAFILIDYKGGGLAGAFENKKNNIRLPHLAGTITNLDKNELNRTLVSIQSELTRRQAKFNEARDELGESTIDIYKYQKFFREGKLKQPMPHLFIVCDEFAELKSQQPDFMDNLISAARIGRSLGVHLILATQKPSGVVNDQIWSNTKFRICLKVATPSDSNEIIKCPDAAEIKNAGRFYLQVGQNEIFVLSQSGWCGAPYSPSDEIKKEYDRSLSYIDNVGNVIKNIDDDTNKKKMTAQGDELANILKYISFLANMENLKSDNLWLDSIPETIMLDDIIRKYNFSSESVTAVLGEYDDPSNQYQNILTLPLNEDSNTMVYGLSGNNREMFLRTLIYSTCANYSSEDVNFYIFDFGSESFRIFSKLPHVGDIVFSSETDKVDKLLKLIEEEMLERKKLFADYNGDYSLYCKNSGKKVPLFVVVFNNYESFKESYTYYDEILLKLTREAKRYGIIFIIATTSQSGLYSKFLKNFDKSFVLDMNSKDGYIDILGRIGNIYPAELDGRGLFKGESVYEFQTAQICEEDNIVEFIKQKAEELSIKNKFKAKPVPVLPDIITIDMLKDSFVDLKSVPIGIEKISLKVSNYNFKSDKATIIGSNELESCKNVVTNLLKMFKGLGTVVSILMDFEQIFEDLKPYSNSYCNKDFELFVDQLLKFIDEKIANTNYNFVLFIAGVEKYKEYIPTKKIEEINKKVKSLENARILYIEAGYKLKKLVFDSWYTDFIVNSNGIWIGNGLSEQSAIKIGDFSKKYSQKIGDKYGWNIRNGEGVLIKLISGDKDEE